MARIGLILDSTANLPAEVLAGVAHRYVRFPVVLADEDCEAMSSEEFVEKVKKTKAYPKTSALRAEDIASAARDLVEGGADALLMIHLSATMSRPTADAAAGVAAKFADAPFETVDSRSAAAGVAAVALRAVRLVAAGGELASIASALRETAASRTGNVIATPDLTYLYHGGRIGAGKALMGSLLHMVPVLQVSCMSGLIEPVGRARKTADVNAVMVARMRSHLETAGGVKVSCVVQHAGNPDAAGALADLIRKELPCEELHVLRAPVASVVHVGPGAWMAGYTISR